jgi:AGZA family xanthine/uracil permease-like MFS transporter
VLLADGIGAVVGSALGSPFPPAVYIGHPGWKKAGGRSGYSMATGVAIALLCFLGLFGLLGAVLPMPAIVPILLYIGLLIGAQAFQHTPRAHAAAVVAALIPNIASWASGQMDNVLSAAGTSAAQVGEAKLEATGVFYAGLNTLGQGAILVGMLLGALVACIIDKRFVAASIFALAGSALSFIGLIHAPKVGWDANPKVALGYLFMAVLLAAFALTRPARRVPDADEVALDGTPAPTPATEPVAATEPETESVAATVS